MNTKPMTTRPSIGGIIKNGAIAGIGSMVINAVLYFIGAAMNAFPADILTPMGQPMTIGPVVSVTLMGAVAGTLGYLVLTRFLPAATANRWFTILAVLVIILMVFTPLQLPGLPMMGVVLLEIMHLVIGGALIYFLPRSV